VRATIDAVSPLLQTVGARQAELAPGGGGGTSTGGASKAVLDALLAQCAGLLDASAGCAAEALSDFRERALGMGALSGVVGEADSELEKARDSLQRLGLDMGAGPSACLSGARNVQDLVRRREALKAAANGHQAKAMAIQAAAAGA